MGKSVASRRRDRVGKVSSLVEFLRALATLGSQPVRNVAVDLHVLWLSHLPEETAHPGDRLDTFPAVTPVGRGIAGVRGHQAPFRPREQKRSPKPYLPGPRRLTSHFPATYSCNSGQRHEVAPPCDQSRSALESHWLLP